MYYFCWSEGYAFYVFGSFMIPWFGDLISWVWLTYVLMFWCIVSPDAWAGECWTASSSVFLNIVMTCLCAFFLIRSLYVVWAVIYSASGMRNGTLKKESRKAAIELAG